MSTDIVLLGFTLSQATVFNFSGFFGGCFPALYDIFTRQKTPSEQKIDIDIEFILTKCIAIPLCALIVTGLAVAFESVTSWVAAIYLGASLPVLIEKALNSGQPTVNNLASDQ